MYSESQVNCAISASVVGIFLNLVLPMAVKNIATDDEIKPPNGAAKLTLKEQLVHMLVHHSQVPLSSSIIIAAIVFLSVLISYKFKKSS